MPTSERKVASAGVGGVVAIVLLLAVGNVGLAQEPAAPPITGGNASERLSPSAQQKWMVDVQQISAQIDADLEYLKQHAEDCDPERAARIQGLRQRLPAWRSLFEPNIEAFKTWIEAQESRLLLGAPGMPAESIDALVTRYKELERAIVASGAALDQRVDKANALIAKLDNGIKKHAAACAAPH